MIYEWIYKFEKWWDDGGESIFWVGLFFGFFLSLSVFLFWIKIQFNAKILLCLMIVQFPIGIWVANVFSEIKRSFIENYDEYVSNRPELADD